MFIAHCHVGTVHFGISDNPEDGTIPRLVQILDEVGAEGAGVFAPFPDPSLGWGGEEATRFSDPNEWLLETLDDYPQLRGFATINPADPDAAAKLRHFITSGLVGAKVHPPVQRISLDDPALEPFWQTAEELGIPVHIHTGVHGGLLKTYRPLLLDEIAHKHPDLNIIMDHLGGYALFYEALAVLNNNANVYAGFTQVSGRAQVYSLPADRADIVIETIGPDRIIYGLDYPWNPDNLQALRDDIQWVAGLGLSHEDTDKILGGNILRLTSARG